MKNKTKKLEIVIFALWIIYMYASIIQVYA
jgi:hypothetical protein